jgi:SNF2 family DNA or RNA helicase
MKPLRPLFPHQQEALDWTTTRDRIALFMEMRLGKSTVAIRWADARVSATKGLGRVLIVGPLSVLDGWIEELNDEGVPLRDIYWLRGKDVDLLGGVTYAPGWYLINYELVRTRPWVLTIADVVIADESTRIRNPSAKTTKAFVKTCTAKYRAILSGLPAPEGEVDYFSQFLFLDGEFLGFKNFWGFRHALYQKIGFDWIPRKGVRDRVKDYVHGRAFIKKRKEVKKEIRVMETRRVDLIPEQKALYRQIKRKFAAGELETKSAGARYSWMARVAGGFAPAPQGQRPTLIAEAKIHELFSLLETDLKGEQVLVWFHFNEELAAVYHALKEKGIAVGAILGATPVHHRHLRRKKFQAGKLQVLCMQEATGLYGLNCSAASAAIYYSNSPSLEQRRQSEERIAHFLKNEPLLYIDLLTRDTIDEDVYTLLKDKDVTEKLFMSKLKYLIQQRLTGARDGEEENGDDHA